MCEEASGRVLILPSSAMTEFAAVDDDLFLCLGFAFGLEVLLALDVDAFLVELLEQQQRRGPLGALAFRADALLSCAGRDGVDDDGESFGHVDDLVLGGFGGERGQVQRGLVFFDLDDFDHVCLFVGGDFVVSEAFLPAVQRLEDEFFVRLQLVVFFLFLVVGFVGGVEVRLLAEDGAFFRLDELGDALAVEAEASVGVASEALEHLVAFLVEHAQLAAFLDFGVRLGRGFFFAEVLVELLFVFFQAH